MPSVDGLPLYPTERWLEAYRDELDASEDLSEEGAGWGVEFNGSI
ncbi:hypothetical protein [Halococcus hamelinensis]|nr:hypothetical protein [Halococcus hamelinensis]